jgi:hypothetical protein
VVLEKMVLRMESADLGYCRKGIASVSRLCSNGLERKEGRGIEEERTVLSPSVTRMLRP